MKSTKEYMVEVKIKNGYLFKMMEEYSIKNINQLSKASGISASNLGRYANLLESPFTSEPKLRKDAQKLCDFFACGIEELFPPEHLYNPLAENAKVRYYSTEEVQRIISEQDADPLSALERENGQERISHIVNDALKARLTDKERMVIEQIFGINCKGVALKSLLAKKMDLSDTRVLQIESKALRKLRHYFYKQNADAGEEARMLC